MSNINFNCFKASELRNNINESNIKEYLSCLTTKSADDITIYKDRNNLLYLASFAVKADNTTEVKEHLEMYGLPFWVDDHKKDITEFKVSIEHLFSKDKKPLKNNEIEKKVGDELYYERKKNADEYGDELKKILLGVLNLNEGRLKLITRRYHIGGGSSSYFEINVRPEKNGSQYAPLTRIVTDRLTKIGISHNLIEGYRGGWHGGDKNEMKVHVNNFLSPEGIAQLKNNIKSVYTKEIARGIKDGRKNAPRIEDRDIRTLLGDVQRELGVEPIPPLFNKDESFDNFTDPYQKVTGQPPKIDIDAVRKFSKIGNKSVQL